jgi:hypothetical protein
LSCFTLQDKQPAGCRGLQQKGWGEGQLCVQVFWPWRTDLLPNVWHTDRAVQARCAACRMHHAYYDSSCRHNLSMLRALACS